MLPPLASPATSALALSTVHAVPISSATSAHLADLQHQVTLKTLSLQTLQSEYASLLQKLQRERTKIQAIEKKSAVAEEEINALTARNEDLADQVKALEAQLEEGDQKREHYHREFIAEKAQWVKMLEMGARIQVQGVEEQRNWVEEKARLLRRIQELEDSRGNAAHATAAAAAPADVTMGPEDAVHSTGTRPQHEATTPEAEIVRLREEVHTLYRHIQSLHAALRRVKENDQALQEQIQASATNSAQIRGLVDEALQSSTSLDNRLREIGIRIAGRSSEDRETGLTN
ncbi:hypothetical protein H2203_001228 [Taxawa tesnikishii (nom. ined.)]|nr:hypothetical protein H2203_001228 [Dothideales sp. JES 119]